MSPSSLHYFPVAWPYFLLLFVLYAAVVGLVVRYASIGMGVRYRTVLAVLLVSLLGSYVNIPIATLPEREVSSDVIATLFGVPYVIPAVREWPATVIAINLGGAVVPLLLSAYLMVKNRLYLLSLIGSAAVAAVCYALAQPVPRVGIAEPVFVPPLATAIVALALSRRHAAALAFVSGTLGTLVGADLLNIGKIQGLGAPIASIGGAGTFDGIFVTGLVAVLYASLVTHGRRRHQGDSLNIRR